jgi:hypothetical protein
MLYELFSFVSFLTGTGEKDELFHMNGPRSSSNRKLYNVGKLLQLNCMIRKVRRQKKRKRLGAGNI